MMRFDEILQISTNPRLKCDENDEMMMMFYKIQHKSARKSRKSDENDEK